MENKIFWGEVAKADLNRLVAFLLDLWNVDVVTDLETRIEAKIALMKQNPYAGRIIYPPKAIRKIIVHRRTALFYIFHELDCIIEIIGIIDTRENPEHKLFE